MKPWQKWTLAGGAVLLGVVLIVLVRGIGIEVGTYGHDGKGRTTTHIIKLP